MRKLSFKLFILAIGVWGLSAVAADKGKPSETSETVKSGQPVGKREEGEFVIEKRNDGSTVKYKKKTSYDFEGSNIEGLYNKPSGSYISNIKDVKGRTIIRVRENFDAEVIDSSRQLK